MPPIPSEDQFTGVSSPATRPRLSHRKLHVGDWRTFLWKFSQLDPSRTALSLAATQQAEPMLAYTQSIQYLGSYQSDQWQCQHATSSSNTGVKFSETTKKKWSQKLKIIESKARMHFNMAAKSFWYTETKQKLSFISNTYSMWMVWVINAFIHAIFTGHFEGNWRANLHTQHGYFPGCLHC